MLWMVQPRPDTIRSEVRDLAGIKSLAVAAKAVLAGLLRSKRPEGEEFTVMLPPEAPDAALGTLI